MSTTSDDLSVEALAAELVQSYGHLIGGHDLVRISGCSSRRDLTMKTKSGRVGFRVFSIEGRAGAFALTRDIANWLWGLRSTASVAHDVSSVGLRAMANAQGQGAPQRRGSNFACGATPRTER